VDYRKQMFVHKGLFIKIEIPIMHTINIELFPTGISEYL
jgi:hypothetical protein